MYIYRERDGKKENSKEIEREITHMYINIEREKETSEERENVSFHVSKEKED